MLGQKIQITNERRIFNRRFQVNSLEFTMKFRESAFLPIDHHIRNSSQERVIESFYLDCFGELLNYIENVLGVSLRDFVGIKFQVDSIEDSKPFGLYYREMQEYSAEILTDLLMKLQQSNDDFRSHETLTVVVTIVKNPVGSGRIVMKRSLIIN